MRFWLALIKILIYLSVQIDLPTFKMGHDLRLSKFSATTPPIRITGINGYTKKLSVIFNQLSHLIS